MALVNWDPVRQSTPPVRWDAPLSTREWNPAVDVLENANEMVFKVELPGMNVKDIEVNFHDKVLTIKGERRFEKETKEEHYHRVEREYGHFSRSFALPAAVKGDHVLAEYKDGVLKVVLPKKEETMAKAIRVEALG